MEWICEDSAKRPWLSGGLLKRADAPGNVEKAADVPRVGGVATRGRAYSGAAGKLAAAAQFVCEADGPRDVYIYMSYIGSFSCGPLFAAVFAELMRGMTESGHKIKSVRNIGFDAGEIFERIETRLLLLERTGRGALSHCAEPFAFQRIYGRGWKLLRTVRCAAVRSPRALSSLKASRRRLLPSRILLNHSLFPSLR